MLKQILMNAADASPGNSAPGAAAVPADQPQANAAPTPDPRDEAISKLTAIVEGLAKSVNSLHADRRRGAEDKPKATAKQDTNDTNQADDPSSLLALRDAFDDATTEIKLTKGQRQILRDTVMSKRLAPGDVDGFVTSFVAQAGWIQTTTTIAAAQPPAQPAPKPQNDRPASDRGTPPPSQVPLAEADLVTMSETDRAALRREKGDAWFKAQLAKQLKGRPITFR